MTIIIHPAELLLIVLLLAFWAATIAVFLRKWRSIRILQPGEPRFKHAPKNLETIKVVARHRDSVIYNNYSDNLAKTMQARQKRLDRMNTMPNMKLGELIPLNQINEVRRGGSCVVVGPPTPPPPSPTPPLPRSPLVLRRDSIETRTDGCLPGAKHYVQPSSSATVNFHSNVTISPVLEVEEADENETIGQTEKLPPHEATVCV